jgi:hypothetical protein
MTAGNNNNNNTITTDETPDNVTVTANMTAGNNNNNTITTDETPELGETGDILSDLYNNTFFS